MPDTYTRPSLWEIAKVTAIAIGFAMVLVWIGVILQALQIPDDAIVVAKIHRPEQHTTHETERRGRIHTEHRFHAESWSLELQWRHLDLDRHRYVEVSKDVYEQVEVGQPYSKVKDAETAQ